VEMSCAPRRSAGAARCQPWAARRCATRSRFAYQQVCPATHGRLAFSPLDLLT
jgi:hypothetical protein